MGMDSKFAFDDQPRPTTDEESQSVTDLVVEDLKIRREGGILKYGVELHTHNGRDALKDLYQEMLDGLLYLRQHLQEREDAARKACQETTCDAPSTNASSSQKTELA